MKKITLSALGLVLALTAGAAFAADKSVSMSPKGEHSKHFAETDTNGDGAISKEEWVAKGDKMFNEMDANHDGKLTKEEMKAHHDMKRAEWQKRKAEQADKLGAPKGQKPAEKK